jgi:exopolysaccharide biosynthesis predicted pyruvyltransferase EpsI
MRKKEHIHEMMRAATIDQYLKDTVKQVRGKINKTKIEQDKKECFFECLPSIRNYGSRADARDGVLEFLEDILDGTLDLHETRCLNRMYSLLQEYEYFDAGGGEASQCKDKVKKIILKYCKNESISPHSLPSVMHFREQMEGFY